MDTADVHVEMKNMEMLHRQFKPDAKYLKVSGVRGDSCAI
jgi:hypothetical protein